MKILNQNMYIKYLLRICKYILRKKIYIQILKAIHLLRVKMKYI